MTRSSRSVQHHLSFERRQGRIEIRSDRTQSSLSFVGNAFLSADNHETPCPLFRSAVISDLNGAVHWGDTRVPRVTIPQGHI
jgi:hypothetical protein